MAPTFEFLEVEEGAGAGVDEETVLGLSLEVVKGVGGVTVIIEEVTGGDEAVVVEMLKPGGYCVPVLIP
jgi:hypothetical protein